MAADPVNDPAGYAEEQVRAWSTALEALQQGQEYTIGGVRNGRTLKRADLAEVRQTLDYWQGKLAQTRRGSSVKTHFVVTR